MAKPKYRINMSSLKEDRFFAWLDGQEIPNPADAIGKYLNEQPYSKKHFDDWPVFITHNGEAYTAEWVTPDARNEQHVLPGWAQTFIGVI